MNIINIKDKEFYLVAILIVMFFGISAATITGSAVRDAIFLIKYEKKFLPLMYVIIAMVMTFVIEIYKRISTNKNPSTFFVLSGSFFIASLFVFHQNLLGQWYLSLRMGRSHYHYYYITILDACK